MTYEDEDGDESEILNCPFCDKEPDIRTVQNPCSHGNDDPIITYFVKCWNKACEINPYTPAYREIHRCRRLEQKKKASN